MLQLFTNAEETIDIASFYWTLSASVEAPEPGDGSTLKGKQLLDAIIDAGETRNVTIRIAVDKDRNSKKWKKKKGKNRIASTDLHLLRPVADIRELNFTKLVGAGVLHTKFILVDGKHFYLGSANMDWRSITHVKELGAVITDCSELANDLRKIFEVYWYLGAENATIPETWPQEYSTNYNLTQPLFLTINDTTNYSTFLASEPNKFCANGRTQEINAILSLIDEAKTFIYISVMNYYPLLYGRYTQFWPVIDDALKKAAIERKVSVRLLVSRWPSSRNYQSVYLKSLNALNKSEAIGGSVEVKLFVVPSFTEEQSNIPFARVNHDKFMVTENSVYIGTSNWEGGYFTDTAGVAIIMTPNNATHFENQTNLKLEVQSIFIRDWFSSYAHNLEEFDNLEECDNLEDCDNSDGSNSSNSRYKSLKYLWLSLITAIINCRVITSLIY
jgi:phospholipase D3/4